MMDVDGWMWGGGWVGWLVMGSLMLAFWAALITAAVLGIRYLSASSRTGVPRRAEDLLSHRYARGEIDDEEYRRRLSLLREQQLAPPANPERHVEAL